MKGFAHARLACGCRLSFRAGVDGARFTVLIDQKAPGCPLTWHVADLPLYDHREALRPPTRVTPPEEGEFEEEG